MNIHRFYEYPFEYIIPLLIILPIFAIFYVYRRLKGEKEAKAFDKAFLSVDLSFKVLLVVVVVGLIGYSIFTSFF